MNLSISRHSLEDKKPLCRVSYKKEEVIEKPKSGTAFPAALLAPSTVVKHYRRCVGGDSCDWHYETTHGEDFRSCLNCDRVEMFCVNGINGWSSVY